MIFDYENLEDLLEQGRRPVPGGAWNKKQFEILGIEWPPRQGWKKDIIGSFISPKDIELFISLRSPQSMKKKSSKKKKKTKKEKPLVSDFLRPEYSKL